ncbi:hypothetical protein PDO_5375, partial [Rhizobium sp. PDO1-076]|uniref:hypothetical protein n=1 Tax=Rhizobium sp. PDO1-076 TaxID=1125979 RepID=UPI00024E25F4
MAVVGAHKLPRAEGARNDQLNVAAEADNAQPQPGTFAGRRSSTAAASDNANINPSGDRPKLIIAARGAGNVPDINMQLDPANPDRSSGFDLEGFMTSDEVREDAPNPSATKLTPDSATPPTLTLDGLLEAIRKD